MRRRYADMTLRRIRDWEEFRELARRLKPKIIFYCIEDNPLGRPPIALRLLFVHDRDTYVFNDFAHGDRLRKSGYPVEILPSGAWISKATLKRISKELGDVELADFSMTTIL